jgi:NitT/TauT family transport system substrate-binding protein
MHSKQINRRQFIHYSALGLGTSVLAACTNTSQQSKPITSTGGSKDKVKLGLSWVAEAEYGGFYQALATGLYKDYNLDVTIVQGGPRINGSQLLLGGELDFYLGQSVDAIKAVESSLPKTTVAAIFQKEIQILMAHPNTGVAKLSDLKERPIWMGAAADVTYWPLLKAKYGLTDRQKRPYNFNPAPFLNDKKSIQQGLLTAEPYTIEQKGGFQPVILTMADSGYDPYNFTIETTNKMIDTKPEVVQRFVDASIKGWYSYLKNPEPGNVLIKKDNPEMTDAQIAYSIAKLQEYQVIDQGDAKTMGIGAMTDARWEALFKELSKVKVFKPDTDYRKAYTLKFANKGLKYYGQA